MVFNAAAALFALYMILRHGPAAVRSLRRGGPRGAAWVPVVNLVLALGILVVAVKGLAAGLISR